MSSSVIIRSECPGPDRPPRRWARRLAVCLFVFCFLLSAFYFSRALLLRSAASLWIVNDPPQKADAIVLLGGGLETRPFAAAKLYREGFASRILVARSRSSPTDELGLTTRDIDIARQVLLKQGVPEAAILEIGQDVASTYDEAIAVRQWFGEQTQKAESRKQKTEDKKETGNSTSTPAELRTLNSEVGAPTSDLPAVLIPTDPFHTRRVRWLFRKQLKSAGVRVIVEAVPVREYTAADWWRSEHGLVAFQNEVVKLAYYKLKY